MPLRKSAWLEAGWIFASSRLVIFIATAIATLRILPMQDTFWLAWQHWDVYSYIGIALNGYGSFRDTAFFPLWPLLIRALGFVFGSTVNGDYLAGMLLANLFFYLALVLLYQLLSEDFEPSVARNTAFYLAFAAYAIFFFVGYTESLFLFLCVAAFWCLQRSHYWLAGLCGGLLGLTHSQGVLVLLPFLVLVLQRFWPDKGERRNWWPLLRACFPLILIPAGVLLYMLYLWFAMGNPLAFSVGEAESWGRHLTFPLWSLVLAAQTFFLPQTGTQHELNAIDIIFCLLPLVVLVAGWKKMPLHYALFALAVVLFNMCYPQGTQEPLTAAPRYMLVVFPVFVILGKWGKNPTVDRLITVCSVCLFALNTLLYVRHYWVA